MVEGQAETGGFGVGTAADTVAGLEHDATAAAQGEFTRRGDAGAAGANDEHVWIGRQHRRIMAQPGRLGFPSVRQRSGLLFGETDGRGIAQAHRLQVRG